MGFFGFGKKDKKEPKQPSRALQESETQVQPVARAVSAIEGSSTSLLGPRITEKASFLAEDGGAYTFNVSPQATKGSVSDAIEKLYKVHVEKVRVVQTPSKNVFVRGKRGVKKGGYKAYVYLRQGEKIEIA